MCARFSRHAVLTAFLIIATANAAGAKSHHGGSGAADDAASTPSIAVLNERVAALESLDGYGFTQAQLRTLLSMADPAAAELPPAGLAASKTVEQYRAALSQLCTALQTGSSDLDTIDSVSGNVDKLADAVDYQPPTRWTFSAEVRKNAKTLAAQLNARQLAGAMANSVESIASPAELLTQTLATKSWAQQQKQWEPVRDQAAAEAAYLAGGWDGADAIKPAAVGWLNDADVAAVAGGSLEQQAAAVLKNPDGWAVLHHWLERDLAQLLSNPQLKWAIQYRLK